MPQAPEDRAAAARMSRKRCAEAASLSQHNPEKRRACWGILTSQGWWWEHLGWSVGRRETHLEHIEFSLQE